MAKDGKEYCSLPGTVEDSSEQVGIVFQGRDSKGQHGTLCPSYGQQGKLFQSWGQCRIAQNRREQCSGAGYRKNRREHLCISYEQQQTLLQGLGQLRTARDRR